MNSNIESNHKDFMAISMAYYRLCKPKIIYLLMFTSFVGMLLSTRSFPPLEIVLFGNIGIGLAAAAGAVINNFIDHKIDNKMERTQSRPIPKGEMNPVSALFFAGLLIVISMILMVVFTNFLSAFLTFISMIGYALIYTIFLKRSTPQNIVWGGIAGAAPPLIGWTSVTGEVGMEAIILTLIIFIWTPPHFWALAIKRRNEYEKVDIPMLPVTHGIEFTKQHIFIYTLMLFAVTLLPYVMHMSGEIYLIFAIILGGVFIIHAYRLVREEHDSHAMKTFSYSIYYLMILFAILLIDHYFGFYFDTNYTPM